MRSYRSCFFLFTCCGSIFAAAAAHVLLVEGAGAGTGICRVTTEDGTARWASACDAPTQSSDRAPSVGAWNISVNLSNRMQEIVGFGAAWTDATVQVFDKLSDSDQESLLNDLFEFSNDPEVVSSDALGLRLMRHTIGQSDLTPASIGEWSYDDTPDGKPDPQCTHFSLTAAGEDMVSWLKRMRNIAPAVKLFGSIWSPPQWMKSRGTNSILPEQMDSWVRYVVRYIQEFERRGVRVDALTPQNEPLHSADPAWTTLMDPETEADLATRLAAALLNHSLPTEIWAYDHNTDRPDYPQTVLDKAGDVVRTVAWHCYAPGKPSDVWAPLAAFAEKNPGIRQVMTECWTHVDTGEGFFDLPSFVGYPLQMGAAGALAWTLGGSSKYDVSYPGGCAPCSGLVQVDTNTSTLVKTQDYYTLGHFSKFVPPGSRYLNTSGSLEASVLANAFLEPGGQRVIVLQNRMHSPLQMRVHLVGGSGRDGAGDEFWTAELAARSITTWVLPPA